MKRITVTCLFCFSFILFADYCFSQDLIILKSGDEISSKVLEVNTDLVKYKKWTNKEGPTYSTAKAEIFMIKYANGTKDVFNDSSFSNGTKNSNGGETVMDIDGNVYKTVQIGTQKWMAENLKTTKYRNGDPIINNQNWQSLTTGAYCWYDNNVTTNKTTYGALYIWYAVADSRNIAPAGWHVATAVAWTTLTTFLQTGNAEGGNLTDTGFIHWSSPNTDATNSSGFTALPGGNRLANGNFYNLGLNGSWWSSGSGDPNGAWNRILSYTNSNVNRGYGSKQNGFSVRCVKD